MEGDPGEITRVQELVYELKIEHVMSRNVISVTPDATIGDLKELLRTKRISGVPVVRDGALVGMISIENVILALERGELAVPVASSMTTEVISVRADDTVVSAVNLFARYGYGRFPVVDASGALVGILTKGDIVRGLLRRMEVEWHTEEIQRYRASHIFEDIESDETGLILRYRVKRHDFVRAGEAASKIKRALERLGAHPRIVRRVAVASYEAETNLVIHSVGGEIIAEIHPDRIKLVTVDSGPGIENVDMALQAGFSTAPDWIRELGFGAGMGLSNIKACSDQMKLESQVGVGTRLELTIKLQ
ncbi:MAG: CBS domain-containing protein [Chloroflexi bacterium]|nr:CBS domain-containing protein [Chloroflexota bacterium]